MADLNSVQSFASPNFSVEPVVRRNQQQGGTTPLNMLELANTARSLTSLQKEQALLQPSIEKGVAESKQQVLAAEKAGVDLSQHYADITRSVYGGLLTDPDFLNGKSDAMIKKLDKSKEFLHSIGVPEYNKGQAHKDLITLAKDNPDQANQFIKNIIQQGAGNVAQATQLNRAPTPVSTGQGTQFVQTSPYQGAVNNQFVQGQVPIGTKQVAQPNDGSGLPPGTEYLVGPQGPQPVGYQVPNTQGGVTPAQMNAPANAQKPLVTTLAPSTTTNLAAGTAMVNQARDAASLVPTGQFNANQIIKLADKTNVGQGSQIISSLQGQNAFVPSGSWTGSADNFNQLGHYLAQQTALLAKNPAVGGVLSNTVAGQQLAGQLAGTEQWTEGAIKNTSRVNRALLDATGMYAKGLKKSQDISNGNPLKAIEFQDKWNNTLDIDAVRLIDAFKNRQDDPEGFKQIVKDFGGTDSLKFKRALKQKNDVQDLVSKGQ
jgi:hypothetical protein